MRLTAIMRSLILSYSLVLVLTDRAPLPKLMFGVVYSLFAGWTFIGLRLDQLQTSLRAGYNNSPEPQSLRSRERRAGSAAAIAEEIPDARARNRNMMEYSPVAPCPRTKGQAARSR